MVHTPPLQKSETERLDVLRKLCLLGTPRDPAFDQMTKIASLVFDTPIVLISLVDEGRQWFKSKIGLEIKETPRSQAFCAYALYSTEPMIVNDTLLDARFVSNPLVIGEPHLRFYAGAPLITSEGACLGTFCVMSDKPRNEFAEKEKEKLMQFARLAMMRIETLRNIGYIDPLTQLPNRVRFLEDIDLWKNDLPLNGNHLFAVAIDICDASYFRKMSAAFGSEYADGFLLTITARIVSVMLPAPIYRVDSTVYACVLEARNDENLLNQLFSIRAELNGIIEHQTIPHAPHVVVGAVRISAHETLSDITRALRSALSHARTNRLSTTLYRPDLDFVQQRRFRILAAIPLALISTTQFSLQYQPRINLITGECTGVEALIRWNHPELGVISPAEFIPLAEKTALIREITRWVLRNVLKQAELWQANCYSFVVSLNVSALDLDNDNFSVSLISLLSEYKVDPALIEIEFTESAIVGDPVTVSNQLRRIRTLGVQIAIDDFGAGYSNLAYLKQVPATTLKIDQSFVRMLPNDPDDITIIKAMIDLGRQFGHRIVAEGIETEEAYDLLRGWGCNEGQGYWIARPMIPTDLTTWLLSNEQKHIMS